LKLRLAGAESALDDAETKLLQTRKLVVTPGRWDAAVLLACTQIATATSVERTENAVLLSPSDYLDERGSNAVILSTEARWRALSPLLSCLVKSSPTVKSRVPLALAASPQLVRFSALTAEQQAWVKSEEFAPRADAEWSLSPDAQQELEVYFVPMISLTFYSEGHRPARTGHGFWVVDRWVRSRVALAEEQSKAAVQGTPQKLTDKQ
jgi:hypothetical protein